MATIKKQADDEYTSQREFYISNEKETIEGGIRDRLRKDEINLKIARSKRENAVRIENMKTVNELIQQLFKEARLSIVKKQKQDAKAYQELIKNLIIQGLIRLMEPEVHIRCRKSDHPLVEKVLA